MSDIQKMENKFKSAISFLLCFTTSKLLAYLTLIAGVVVGLILKSEECFIVGVLSSCSLMGVKSFNDTSLKKKTLLNGNVEESK